MGLFDFLKKKQSSHTIEFIDFNFKLAIIQELMYRQKLIQPEFDIHLFVKTYTTREIDLDEEGYEIIPEALAYFKALEISRDLAEKITRIYQDGGNQIYMNITPYWDGEDDGFNIQSFEDIKHFPNLKKMTIFYSEKPIIAKLKSLGIDAEFI